MGRKDIGKFSKYTVDASILLKLVVEEEFSINASKLISDFGNGKLTLYAPSIIDYEIGSVLYKMVRNKIIELKYAQETFVRMLNLSISKVSTADLIAVLRLSDSLGVHFYDCFYLVAAKESRTVLVSADEKMIKTAKKALPAGTAIHIKDYS